MITNGTILNQVFRNGNYETNQQKSTLDNAVRIYNKLPNPDNSIKSNVGIVVGRVQSGKTANVITLSALALDNGHRLVVLFLSDTNNLLTQNTERFVKNFENIDNVEVVKKSKDGDFDAILDVPTLESLYDDGGNLVICSLKHAKHIQEITDLISKTPYKDDYTLIIDDEGDDIGLNTAAFDEKFVEDSKGNLIEEERTATNGAIIGLKKAFSKLGYISLTATPEANILLQDFQQLAPDYCVTMEPNPGYTGLLAFHSDSSDRVVEVDDYCDLLENNGLPESFEEAFTFFIAGCILRKKREAGKKFKHSMMVHPCSKIENHEIVFKKVELYVNKIRYDLGRNNQSAEMFIRLVMDKCKELSPNSSVKPKDILSTIKKTKLHLVNCAQAGNDLNKAMKLMPYHIVIGGNMLDRGITIEGLAVSYMIRMAKKGQADTLLQRARWFGYKQSYIDLCRVYMPKELKQQFSNIIEIEESVWQFLYDCDHNNLSPKSLSPLLQLPQGMKIASDSKAKYITTNLISLTKAQSIIVHDHQKNNDNLNLIKNIIWADNNVVAFSTNQKHRKKTIKADEFRTFVNAFNFSEEDDTMNSDYLLKLLDRLEANEVDIWDMRYETGEKRSTTDYRIKALLQGYSEGKSPNDPDYYIGDRNLRTNNLSIQIHHVILKNDIEDQYKAGDKVIVLAAILPNGYVGGYAAKKISKQEIKDILHN